MPTLCNTKESTISRYVTSISPLSQRLLFITCDYTLPPVQRQGFAQEEKNDFSLSQSTMT